MLTLGSLFSGIGGIELGFERTGRFKTIWNCEIEPYPSAVLEKNFPGVKNYGDITKVDWSGVERPDVLVGGFPCQDISVAGKGAGIKEGTRSGLWSEYARAVRELRPRYVIVENVSMLARRGLTRVLGDLAALGYDAEWFTIRASDVGAPHRRERLFIIAHRPEQPGRDVCGQNSGDRKREGSPGENKWEPIPAAQIGDGIDAAFSQSKRCADEYDSKDIRETVREGNIAWNKVEGVDAAHADLCGCGAGGDNREERPLLSTEKRSDAEGCEERSGRLARPVEDADAPDTAGVGLHPEENKRKLEGKRQGELLAGEPGGLGQADAPDPEGELRCEGRQAGQLRRFPEFKVFENIVGVKDLFNRPDIPEPLVRGVNDGLPKGLDGFIRKERTKALGNAVVPAVAEVIAWRVVEMEASK